MSITTSKRSARKITERTESHADPKPACGLCGKTTRLTKTECCDRWICDDESEYVLFSYARNSCHRNHRRFTLCGSHHTEGHKGSWKTCAECREGFETEMYVWFGTNEYNFEKLDNPPSFRPTFCAGCHRRISLVNDGYVMSGGKYWCEPCGFRPAARRSPKRKRRAGA